MESILFQKARRSTRRAAQSISGIWSSRPTHTKSAKSETSDFVGGAPFETRRVGRIWSDPVAVCLVRSTTTHFASRLGLEPNPPRQNGSI